MGVATASAQSAPLLQTAIEAIGRATSNSEVLTLNLTNLLILVALKIAIIAFGMISGGGLGASGRSANDPAMDQVDMTGGLCFLMYTAGQTEKMDCIARAACESPVSAGKFVKAAKLWHKMHSIIEVLPYSEKYSHITNMLEEASNADDCSVYQW